MALAADHLILPLCEQWAQPPADQRPRAGSAPLRARKGVYTATSPQIAVRPADSAAATTGSAGSASSSLSSSAASDRSKIDAAYVAGSRMVGRKALAPPECIKRTETRRLRHDPGRVRGFG
jgi:hypothetical protein